MIEDTVLADVDEPLRDLVRELNADPAVTTISSGWSAEGYYVDFLCDPTVAGWEALSGISVLTFEGEVVITVRVDDEFDTVFTLMSGGDDGVSADLLARRLEGYEDKRVCGHCGLMSVSVGFEEHDACIPQLPGVAFACCGHLDEEQSPYVFEEDGRFARGQAGLDRMRELGGNPPAELTPAQERHLRQFYSMNPEEIEVGYKEPPQL